MRSMRPLATVVVSLAILLSQPLSAFAATTGGITGTVIDSNSGAPVAGARVIAASPSQQATSITDASGHFAFLTLAPDTYTITADKANYSTQSVPGQVVFADTVQTVTVRLQPALRTIAHVTSAAGGALVKSGTTADIYSINSATQSAASALGGGGNLNSAYSAISTVPGAYVVPNQSGYYDTVHIRGGDFDQVGYEFDGVPVNRSFDNYPSGAASSLGNAEVEVYTGANPANSEGQGLAGYINQVIRTGTFPGFADGQLGIGTPTYYHRAEIEAGGATPDRLLSYYFGVAGYNQGFNFVNDQNGANYDNWLGQPMSLLLNPHYAEGGYYLGPFNWMNFAQIASRDTVANVHLAIPHRNDAGRDDVQLLWDSSYLDNSFYSSNNDVASPQCSSDLTAAECWGDINPFVNLGLSPNFPAGGTTPYIDGLQWKCQTDVGNTFTKSQLLSIGPGCTSRYFYPFSSENRPWTDFATGSSYGFVPDAERDSSQNQQEIVKLQYTKNFGSTAYARIYGYTYYSTWDLVGPQCAAFLFACPTAPDYELSSHTRGISIQGEDQIDSENLLTLQGNYTTASTIRDNNTQMYNNFPAFGGPNRTTAAIAVNAADPYSGYCYSNNKTYKYEPVSCNPEAGQATIVDWDDLYEPGASEPFPQLPTECIDPRVPGKTKCAFLLAENSEYATYNNVIPRFASTSFTDQFRPNDKILLNLGVRGDSFTFLGQNGSVNDNGGVARQFWYNAYNLDTCVSTLTGAQLSRNPGAACPSGSKPADLVNEAYQNFTFNEWQPRFSGTYTVNPDNVVRASFGRYTEAPNTAYEIYNTLENDIPFALLGPNLYQYGRSSPGLAVYPPTSLNYDVSLEHHFKGTDLSFKVTPFLRQTQNQIQNFFLNQATGFISGLNVGSQRSQGVEFQMQKGDFTRNGFSGLLSFAYTNSYTRYGTLSNGSTIISPINVTISNYNAYTRACAKGGAFYGRSEYGIPLCGAIAETNSTGSSITLPAAPCYKDLKPVSCKASGAVINPYWNQPGQNFINPGQNFTPYDIFPAGIGSSANGFNSPYVSSLLLNYRWNKVALTPSVQFQGGAKYGAPETTPGIDPANGACIPLVGSHRYDAANCPASLVIPDPFTGVYDDLGSFTQPNELMVNLQATYDVSPRITLTAVLANIVNTCWGGTKEAWTYTDSNVCSYGVVGNGLIPPVGNAFNPYGSTSRITTSSGTATVKNANTYVQQFLLYPYEPALGPFLVSGLNNSVKQPFQAYFSANIKI